MISAEEWAQSKMSLDEWDQRIDAWVKSENAKAGIAKEMSWEGDPGNELKGFDRGITNKVITQDMIRKVALGIGDMNPLYRDPAYAAKTRWGGIIAPPLIIHTIANPSVQLPSVPEDVGGTQLMDGGVENYFYDVVRPMDSFTVKKTYLGAFETKRKKREKRMFICKNQCDYYNQNNVKVATGTGLAIVIAVAPGTPPVTSGLTPEQAWATKQPHYDDATLQVIYDEYEKELALKLDRGAEPRYWDDVQEGEEITPLHAGPLEVNDMIAFVSQQVNIGYPGCFAHGYWLSTRDPIMAYVDPETGCRTTADWHYDRIAKYFGFPQGVHYGAMSMQIISHALTSWAGDDAFITKMNFQCRAMTFMGDTNTVKATITKKYEKDGQYFVDVKGGGENQNGVVHTTVDATIRLPKRA